MFAPINYTKLIMLLVDHDNNRTVIECNDTSQLRIINFGNNSFILKNVLTFVVTDLASAVETVLEYYK